MRLNRYVMFRPIYAKGGDNRIEETSEQKELARIASERWSDYQTTFAPAENKFIDEMVNYDNPARVSAIEQSAAADVQNASADAWSDTSRAMTSAGVDPSSGSFKAAISDQATNTARAGSEVVNSASQAIQDARVQGMKNVVAIGNGQSADAMQSMADVAGDSATKAAESAIRKDNRRASTHEALGTVTGGVVRGAIGHQEDKQSERRN